MAIKTITKQLAKKQTAVSKKTSVSSAAPKKVPGKKVASKLPSRRPSRKPDSQGQSDLSSGDVPLGYTIATLAVSGGVAGFMIDSVFYGLGRQMGRPVSVLFPIDPENWSDEQCFEALNAAMDQLQRTLQATVKKCGTCCQ